MHNISVQEAFDMLSDNNTTLIDVRGISESEIDGRPDVKNSILITISSDLDEFEDILESNLPDKNQKILFICRSGGRSMKASMIAEQMGYMNCYNVEGGFTNWKSHGLPSK